MSTQNLTARFSVQMALAACVLWVATGSFAADLDVTAGNVNLDSGYTVTIGGEQAIALGGPSERSVWSGVDAGNGEERCVGIGWEALRNNTDRSCVGIGSLALKNNEGIGNVGIGANALRNNTGQGCLGIGDTALMGNSGGSCTAIGSAAMQNNAAAGCVGIGFQALRNNTISGGNTIGIGFEAGEDNTYSSCILMGYQASATTNNQIVFGSDNSQGTYTEVYIGKGISAASPSDVTVSATNSSGANDGADLILTGGTSVSGTDGRVQIINELTTPVLEITGGNDLAEKFPVRELDAKKETAMVALLLNHGAKK
jgi:hypothetical protein